MATTETTTKTLQLPDVKAQLSDLVDEVVHLETRVRIEDAGTAVAALISAADFDRLTRLEQEENARWKAIEAIGEAFADVPWEELEAQLERIAAEGPQIDEAPSERRLA